MNSKKAKALRKVLKNLQTQQPDIPKLEYTENKQNRKFISVEDLDADGNTITKQIPIASGTVTVNERSIRGLYKRLKKVMSAGEHKEIIPPVNN